MPSLTPRLPKRRLADRYELLLGAWNVEVQFPGVKRALSGSALFRRLGHGPFLEMRSRVHGGPPSSVSVIGADDAEKTFCMLYSDDRGVARRYEMTLSRRQWTLTRRSSGFSQRFVGRFSVDLRSIEGAWEKSPDGKRWEHDFKVTYRRKP